MPPQRFTTRSPPAPCPSLVRSLPSPSPSTIFRAESSAALLRLFARARGAHATTPRHDRGRKRVRGVVRRARRFKSPRDTRGEYEPTPPFRVIPRAPLSLSLSLSLFCARAQLADLYTRAYIYALSGRRSIGTRPRWAR